jgi:hypothetical protein
LACFNYSVFISQTDIDAALAAGSFVRVDYYPCPGGILTPKPYPNAGTFTDDICNDDAQGTPSTPYWIDGGNITVGSSSTNPSGTLCGITPTPTITPTQTPTVTQTPTPSVTSTITQTPTRTPTQTPTLSITPTISKTPSVTPTTTLVLCVSGTTTGSHFYTDCCGNFITSTAVGTTITYNPQLPNNGIVSLGGVATTSCGTPTPTPTPTNTPTVTVSPTNTLTPTRTPANTPNPTNTPAPTQVITLQNNCSVFTLFDMGVTCRTLVQPSNTTSFDGVLTLDITGGTSPYSIYWADSSSKSATRNGLKEGIYEAIVVDFYGDYTASTFCSVDAIVPSPTPTMTLTPTPSSQPVYSSLCVLISGLVPALAPIQFTYNGIVNGRPVWVSGTYTMSWSVSNQRWQINGLSVNGGTVVSTTTSTPPLSNWTVVGATTTPIPQVAVLQGTCPTYTPMTVVINSENSDCGNDGGISVVTSGGLPPYQYSINGGATYTTSSVFNGLSPNTYNVVVKDTTGLTIQRSVVITQTGAPTTYSLSVANTNLQNLSRNLRRATWQVNVTPPIPVGTTLSFVLNIETIQDMNSPGSGVTSSVSSVYVASSLVSPNSTNTNTSVNPRPNCSPFTTQRTNILQSYNVTMSAGTVVSGFSDSSLSITSGTSASNGCVTNLQQEISVVPQQGIVNGCQCCTVSTNNTSFGGLQHSLSFGDGGTTQNYSQVVLGVGQSTSAACIDETLSPLRIINAPSFGVGVTIFGGNPTSPSPLLGYSYCAYQTGLYIVNPSTGQVTGAVLSPGGSQVFC